MFDKKGFRILLEKAMGSMNQTEYANKSGVNRTYISKYLNEKLDQPPTPDVIKRLALFSENGITYEDFMQAAGHIKITRYDEREDIDIYNEDGELDGGYSRKLFNASSDIILNRKDEKDVEKLLNRTMDYIEEQEGLMLNGEILDENDLLLLKQAIKNGLEIAKISNKKRFTPKRYRKE
jgi:HTH-type transcriptional regulator, competence development regulator